jgi:hypothetical protein
MGTPADAVRGLDTDHPEARRVQRAGGRDACRTGTDDDGIVVKHCTLGRHDAPSDL